MFGSVGADEETGGDGAGDVSTVLESESKVCRRRLVVTKRLVVLGGESQHCLLVVFSSKSRSLELLEKAFDEGILCSN